MITKTRPKGWMLRLLSALFLLIAFTACSSTEDSAEDSAKPKPEVPINDGDWQTVPVTGGTITKDSLSITFPSGTFSEDVKVAITEVKKGEIGGEYEASKFYQIAMPCTASKSIVLKMKSSEKNDNICFVAQADAFSVCTGGIRKVEHHYETNYSNGEYSASIPAIKGDLDENFYFTIGLGRILDPSTGKTRTRAYKNQVLFEGNVKNVNYQIRYMWTIFDQISWSIKGDETFDKIINLSGKVHNYVKESITKILDLGFKVEGNPTIYIDFDTSEKDWGGHQFCALPLSTSWSTYVSLGTKMLTDKETTDTDIKCTVIHEIFHWFQTHYDPRSNYKKAKGGGEEVVIYEMGGAWIENLINDGQLNAKFLNYDVLREHVLFEADRFGLTDMKERIGNNYQQQGYLMSPLLYYLCSSNEMKDYGFSNKSVLELHDLFSAGFNVSVLGSNSFARTIDIMDDWARIYHDSNFFLGTQIDDYYLKLLSGELVKGIDIFSIWQADSLEKGSILIKSVSNSHKEFNGNKLYSYGCNFRAFHLYDLKNESLKEKQFVIKQEKEGIQTYVLTANKTDKKYKKIGTISNNKDSVVVSGNELESYRKNDGSLDQYFFIITTRTENPTSDTGPKSWKVTAEIQDKAEESKPASVSPTSVSFEAEGGTDTTVKINKGSYKHCDVEVPEEFREWLSAKASDDGAVSITTQPNTGEEREGKIKCWVSNKDNPADTDKKYIDTPVIVTQKAGDSESLLDQTDLVFPVEGGVKFIKYGFGPYLWLKRTWDDDSWLRTTWSSDYLKNIGYNPSDENRYANQLYVCCFPNETGSDRKQTITFSYSNEKGFDFDKGDKFPVKVKQEGGTFNLDMMKNLFVGTWYTARDIEYNRSEGHYYHRRYNFRADNTIILEGKTSNSTDKPATWDTEFTGTYSVLSYEVKGECVRVYIKVPKDNIWYKILIERFPHYIYFAYENSDGSVWHGAYMEPE